MSKVYFLNYSDENFDSARSKTIKQISDFQGPLFDGVFSYGRLDLIQTEFYRKNKKILDHPRGGGWCAWKSFYILKTLDQLQDGDILLYADSADKLCELQDLRAFLIERMKNTDVLLTAGAFKCSQYTKRDTFILMNCDKEEYWNDIQIEAGVIVVKKTELTQIVLLNWMALCQDERIITDIPNQMGQPDLPDFVDIRYDQSILSLMFKMYEVHNTQLKNQLMQRSHEIRKFVHCNQNTVEN